MEIRLKTAEEFRDAHMTIEIRATPEEWERTAVNEGNRAAEAETALIKVRAERETLEKGLADYDRARIDLNERMKKAGEETARKLAMAEAALVELRGERDRLVKKAENESRRADQNKEWAKREQSWLIEARDKIVQARHILSDPKVEKARNEILTSKGVILADAIRNALAALSE